MVVVNRPSIRTWYIPGSRCWKHNSPAHWLQIQIILLVLRLESRKMLGEPCARVVIVTYTAATMGQSTVVQL